MQGMESLQLTDSELKYYSDLFGSCDVENNSKISGTHASDLFFKSGLSNSVLHQITELCGAKRLGHFGRSQFYIALRLIALVQSGHAVSVDSLHSNYEDLPLPKFDAVQDHHLQLNQLPVQKKGALPPPPTKNHVRSKSGHNILSIIDPNPVSPFPARSVPCGEKAADHCEGVNNGVRRSGQPRLTHHQSLSLPARPQILVHQRSYPTPPLAPSSSHDSPLAPLEGHTTSDEGEEDDKSEEHLTVESHQWTQFSDDDRGLISAQRKPDWSAGDALDGVAHHDRSSSPTSSNSTSSDESDSADEGRDVPPESSPGYSPLEGHYAMSKEQRDYYTSCFRTLQPHTDGQLGGATAKRFFEISNLPGQELAHIWQLADLNQDGQLNLVEFCIAMHLVVLRKNEVPLPDTLPSALLLDDSLELQNEEPFSADLSDPGGEDSGEEVCQRGLDAVDGEESTPLSDRSVKAEHKMWERGCADSPEALKRHISQSKGRSESLTNEKTHPDALKSRPRPTPKKAATLPTGLLPPPSAPPEGAPPPPPPRSRLIGGPFPHDSCPALSLVGGQLDSPQLDVLLKSGSLDKRQLKFLIRQEKERNHTLLRLNNELCHELKEVMEQRVNLGIQLNHLRPLHDD